MIAALVFPAAASADYPQWVLAIRDCADDGKLQGTYSHGALQTALHKIPSDGGEYTDCAMAISRALTGGSGKHDAPPPNGVLTESGAIAASADDAAQLQTVIAQAEADTPTAVELPTQRASANPALSIDRSGGAAYELDTMLLLQVIAAGVALIWTALLVRRFQRRPAA